MSGKQDNEHAAASAPTPAFDPRPAVAVNRPPNAPGEAAGGALRNERGAAVTTPREATARTVVGEQAPLPAAAHQEAAVSAPTDVSRLVAVPSEGDTPAAGPIAARGPVPVRRPVPAGARPPVAVQRPIPARGAPVPAQRLPPNAAVANKNEPAVPVTPVSAKARSTALESWPELIGYDDLLTKTRESRRRRFFGRLAIAVGLPTLLMVFYVFVWATPRYVSEFEVTYQTYRNTESLSSGLVQAMLSENTGSDLGSILYEYTRSATLMHQLDDKMHLREYYSNKRIDYPARLSADASEEKFLYYYRQQVVSVSEGLGGYLTIDVQAFDPEYAHALAKAIVAACDQMVDQMSARARQDGMKFAEEEVARQEDRVRQAQMAETKFQNEHRDLNPTNSANQFGQIVGSLETQLSQTRTSLTNTLSYASPNAPQVQQLKNQIAALEDQLKDQRNRLTGGGDKTYSQILEEYSRLQLEEQFAQNAYQSAQQGLAVARSDAARKESYLVDFVVPSVPDRPTQTFYITYLGSAFLGSLLLYAIGSLLAGAFRDQAGL
jgi:capsular polysaccharide transport system permease protein